MWIGSIIVSPCRVKYPPNLRKSLAVPCQGGTGGTGGTGGGTGRDDRDDLRDALVRGTVGDGHERQVHEESTMHTLPTSINDAAGKEQQRCLVVRDTREGLQTMRPLHLRSREGE